MVIQLKVSPANTLAFALPQDSLRLKRYPSLSHSKHKNYNYDNSSTVVY